VLESITEAERRITVSENDGNNQRIKDMERHMEYVSELLMLLRGPPTVAPDQLVRAVRGANMGAHDLLLILEAIAAERLPAKEAVVRIHTSPQDDDLLAQLNAIQARCAAQDMEIANLKTKLEAGCEACKEKDEEIGRLNRNLTQAQRASPKITRSAAPPPAAPQPPPSIVPPGAKFDKTISATITSDIPGAIIYCTVDGSPPTESNFEQSGPSPLLMQVDKSTRIRAICSANGRTTQAAEAEFVLEAPPAALAGKQSASPFVCLLLPVYHFVCFLLPVVIVASVAPTNCDVQCVVSGVGLLLEKSETHEDVSVKKIIPGGAAQEDGRIKLKDRVTHVDSKPVGPLTLEQVCINSFLPPPPADPDFVLVSFVKIDPCTRADFGACQRQRRHTSKDRHQEGGARSHL
jgi:hypothetical protein